MTDDKGLVDAYSSIYKKEEQLDEIAITGSIMAAKAAMGALKGAKAMGALGKAAKVAGKVGQVADAAGSVGDAANKIRGKGQHHPSQNEEVQPVMENPALIGAAKMAGKAALTGAAMEVGSNIVKKIKGGKKEVKKEEVEGGVSVVDYNSDYTPTEIETVDVIDAPKMKGTEDLHEEEEALEERLWDQVAANLTTLGEMRGVKYQVSPFEEVLEEEEVEFSEGKNAKKKKNDGRKEDLAIEKKLGLPKRTDNSHLPKQFNPDLPEGFNVRSPLTFSKKEEPQVDQSELEEKYACSTKKAHKRLRK